jgi:diguanylate cyclase (GGDEF)-like protein
MAPADTDNMGVTTRVLLPPSAARTGPRDRLLLVEDSVFQATMLEGMLKTGGLDFEVIHVVTLAEARASLNVDPNVGCILLELTLPDAGGLDGVIDMCDAAPEVPIVVVTADEDEARAVKAVQLGAQDYLIKGRIDAQLLGRSVRYAMERKRGELLLAHQALHDPLTGLPNRTLLTDRLQLALAQSERRDTRVAVVFCDLNGFKAVNDTHSHAVGDRVLRSVAARLLSAVRAGDTVARYGGDEFTIVCVEVGGEEDAIEVATRVRSAVSLPIQHRGVQISISTSVGVVLVKGLKHRPLDVIAAADEAMCRAKESGAPYELVEL